MYLYVYILWQKVTQKTYNDVNDKYHIVFFLLRNMVRQTLTEVSTDFFLF